MLDYFICQKSVPQVCEVIDIINSEKQRFWRRDFNTPYKRVDEVKTLCEEIKKFAIDTSDERLANSQYVLLQYYQIFCNLADYYGIVKEKQYGESWVKLQDCIDLALDVGYFLEYNSRYEIPKILELLHIYETLYPYKKFGSTEYVASKVKCSICGKSPLSIDCPHITGNLYWGELALNVIDKLEFERLAIVNNPRDKRCTMELYTDRWSNEHDFQLLKEVFEKVIPLRMMAIEIQKSRHVNQDIKVVGRNDPCSCGSDKKFKKCCGKNSLRIHEHYVIKDLGQIPCITLGSRLFLRSPIHTQQ